MLSMRLRNWIFGVAFFVAVTLTPEMATGFSSGGHRLVADIAYDRLSKEEREHIVGILRKHKDFAKLFKKNMDKEIPGASEEDEARWIFLQASIWPDLIPSRPWHYVNFPLFLSDTDEQALKNVIKPNLDTNAPKAFQKKHVKTLNCIQAVKLSMQEIPDSHTSEEKKAEYYCWLIHIVGDIHQPLHSTSLVSRARFNKDEGDRGGNGIKVKQADDLHSYWDGLHGKQQSLSDIRDRTQNIVGVKAHAKAGESAMKRLDPEAWVQESHQIAKSFVYSKKIKAVVELGEANPKAPLQKVDLDDAYQKGAHEIADRRVAEAGYRLAEILKLLD